MKRINLVLDDATYNNLLLAAKKERRHPGNYLRNMVSERFESMTAEEVPVTASGLEPKHINLKLDGATYSRLLLISKKEKCHPGNYIRRKVSELVDSQSAEAAAWQQTSFSGVLS